MTAANPAPTAMRDEHSRRERGDAMTAVTAHPDCHLWQVPGERRQVAKLGAHDR
jgi:hypothetical protein